METTQRNNETQITVRNKDLPLEDQLQNLLTFFGSEIDKAKDEFDNHHLDKKQRSAEEKFIDWHWSLGATALLLILLSSSLSAKDLCSKKGPDELLRSSTYSGKFFFKYDCKKRKTYFSEEQARVVNDKLEKEITISVKVNPDEYLVIVANRNGIIRTGKHDGLMTIWNEKSQLRLRQVGLAWK